MIGVCTGKRVFPGLLQVYMPPVFDHLQHDNMSMSTREFLRWHSQFQCSFPGRS